jgi:spoIIIJ-associated protein
MVTPEELTKIKEVAEGLLQKMTLGEFSVAFEPSIQAGDKEGSAFPKDFVGIAITTQDPQILIGQQGQTLFELQRLLRIIANKRLKKDFYIGLDINDYKKKKIEYLKALAMDTANQVIATGQKKVLPPMSSYERRVIHAQLADNKDVVTESQGDGVERYVVIAPRS